jgi:hypothetical protein
MHTMPTEAFLKLCRRQRRPDAATPEPQPVVHLPKTPTTYEEAEAMFQVGFKTVVSLDGKPRTFAGFTIEQLRHIHQTEFVKLQ